MYSAMYASSLVNSLVKQLRKLLPRKIVNKVALTNILILFITVSFLSWYSLFEKSSYQEATSVKHYKEYAAQLARISRSFVVSESSDELEKVISSFMMTNEADDVYIKDIGFNTLLSLRKTNNNHVTVISEERKHIAPLDSERHASINNGVLEVWQQIAPEDPVGWVYLTHKIEPNSALTLEFIKTIIFALIFSVAVCLLMLQRILREPMHSLRRVSEFAEWLDMAQGNHLQLQTSSKEVEQLVRTLNKTSVKLFQNGLQEKRRHLLVDTIRDIQTHYIETNDVNKLNDRILKKVVNLSESEYGFLGEVKQGFSGNPYIKILTFSKLSQNISMQNFVEKYSPPNMEFHNTHNLFGTVLQTKKPTIANDPLRDPRSGGLPPGHPPVHSFLALPVFHEKKMVAVIGVANRRGGYDQSLVDYLQPLLSTVGHVVVANRQDRHNNAVLRDLEQKEALLRRILATVSDSIITINAGGFIETVNPAADKMFGYLREEMVNQHVNMLIPKLFHTNFNEIYVSHDYSKYHAGEGRHKDGRSFSVEFTVNEFKIGDAQMFTVTVIDLSHLQNVSLIPGQNERSLFDAQHLVHDGTWELDLETKDIVASNAFFHVLNIQGEQLGFQGFVNAICKEDQQLLSLAVERCALDNEPFVIDVRMRGKTDINKFIQVQGNPRVNDEGEVNKIMGVVKDVTDTTQMLRMKDEFITSISEEIRSPLASIRGSIGILSGEVSKYISDKEKFLLDTAYQNTDRLLLFINDILDIENIATGRAEFSMEFLECKKLLDTVLMANRGVVDDFRVNIALSVKNKGIVLVADKDRLVQLLSILITNAAKHSPLNADIDLIVELVDGSLQITVKDRGEGIPVERQNNLFDLYQRIKYFHSVHPESTGLGLCIAKSIVDRHKGSISLVSQTGKGTTVTIRLPVPQQNVAVLNL